MIPALDEAERIGAAIYSAVAGAADRGRLEVVVADGGSLDGTPERAEEAGARIVRAPRGRARQLAAGAEVASGDVLVLLHADTRLPAGWDVAVRDALADSRVVGGAFRFQFDASPEEVGIGLRVVEWGAHLRAALFGLPYGDQAIFARRDVLDEIGGIPQAPIMEDLDLVRALRRRGRVARLPLPAPTSARRYVSGGAFRTMFAHWIAAVAWLANVDRQRVADWYRR